MTLLQITLALSALNVLLLVSLMLVYGRNFFHMPSSFTAGFFVFGLLFLVHNVLYLYYAYAMMPLYATGLELYALIFTLLQSIGFGALAYSSWK